MKRILLLVSTFVAVLAMAPPSMAAQGLAGCQLAGTANFAPGLGANQPSPSPAVPSPSFAIPQEINWGNAFDYTFSGDLTGCNGATPAGPGNGPAGGKIYAGTPLKINGVDYVWSGLPTPKGNGGCSGSHTSGVSLVVWGDNTVSEIKYSTDGAAAAVGLTGSFQSGTVTLQRKDLDGAGRPVYDTFTLKYGGDYTGGPLAFQPPDPTACSSAAGVKTAAISGAIFRGNYS